MKERWVGEVLVEVEGGGISKAENFTPSMPEEFYEYPFLKWDITGCSSSEYGVHHEHDFDFDR